MSDRLDAWAGDGTSEWHDRKRRGGAGERLVRGQLDAWARATGSATLHTLVAPGERADVDHVAVGSAGVLVVDTKAWTGAVSLDDGVLRRGRRRATRELQGVRDQASRIEAALRRGGVGGVPVRGALCLANEGLGRVGDLGRECDGVLVGHPHAIAAAAAAPGPVNVEQVARAHGALRRAFAIECEVAPAEAGVGVASLVALPGTRRRPAGLVRDRGRSGRVRVPPRRRGRPPLAEATILVLLLAVLAATFGARRQETPLDRSGLDALLPALQQRAAGAAGGPVGPPRVSGTARRFQVRFHRGACRVRLSVNRLNRSDPAAVPIVTTGRC